MSSDTVRIETVKPKSGKRTKSSTATSTTTDAWRMAALVWAVHWMIVQIPATLAYHFGSIRTMREEPPRSGQYVPDLGPKSGAYGVVLDPLNGVAGWIVEPFRHWDGTWYHLVASNNYDAGYTATAAFWPLYPWLMRIGSQVTGLSLETVGYLISNVSFFFALYFLHRLLTLDFNKSVAERSMWALALFPTAFFFNAIYTESLFLFLVVASLFQARRGEWLLAGLIGLLAALTRSAGVMLLAPFGILFIQQYGWNVRRWFPHGFAAALPALGPVLFGWLLSSKGFTFFDWADQQWQWNRFSATPWRTFDCTLNGCTANVRFITGTSGDAYVYPTDWGWFGQLFSNLNWTFFTSSEFRFRFGESHVLELVVTVLSILLVVFGIRRVPLYYTAFVIPALVVPLLTPSSVNPLMSMPRFVLPLFPLFVVAVILVQNRRVGTILLGISSVLLVLLTMQFSLWYWVS